MTDTLRNALRQVAGDVEVPVLDAHDVIAQGEQRLHRRRLTAALAAVAAVAAIAVGSLLVTRADPDPREPLPVGPPSSSTPSGGVDPHPARPLVYADGSTVHVGDKTVEARDPVAFIDATDEGAVYEAALDGTLWFTDGTTTSVIGTSPFTAAPTAHGGVVTTGAAGSLVVWADAAGRENGPPVGLVVYDTSRREQVARIPFAGRGADARVVYVDEADVYYAPSSSPGCWVGGVHPCPDAHLFRFHVASGRTAKIALADLDAVLGTRARMFVAERHDLEADEPGFSEGASFQQVGRRLAAVTSGGDPRALTRANGDDVRLRVPKGYVAPGPEGSGGIAVSQWLDDDHVVLWADDGGGDLPAKQGDLLECPLSEGVCSVAVPRSSSPYVAP